MKKIEEVEEEKKIQYWTKDHIKQSLNGFEDFIIIFLTLIYAGPRKGETMALQEEDLDFENNIYSHITPKMENEAANKFSRYMAD